MKSTIQSQKNDAANLVASANGTKKKRVLLVESDGMNPRRSVLNKRPTKAIAWFEEIGKGDIPIAGGKGAILGEMTKAQIPVPPGFIVTADTYFRFIHEAKLADKIRARLKILNPKNTRQLQEAAFEIKQMLSQAPMPQDMADDIKKAYPKVRQGPVAVRSSATAEDLPEASFAGQQSTFLNVQGAANVVEAVQKCWASLFEARALFTASWRGVLRTTSQKNRPSGLSVAAARRKLAFESSIRSSPIG